MPEDVFRWVIAAGVLLACLAAVWQAFLLSATYRALKEARQAGKETQEKLAPLVDRFDAFLASTSKMLEENRPRIADITAETSALAKAAREQVERIGELVDDASGRAKARIAQIDQTVSRTVDQVDHAGEAVKSAVMRPVREVEGIVAGVKAAWSTYAQGGNRNSPEHATQDEEMFI